MDRERTYALIIWAGAPKTLDYNGLRKRPFWQLYERLVHHVHEMDRILHWREALLRIKASAQGYPTGAVDIRAVEGLEIEALKCGREVAKLLIPWVDWPEIESAEQKTRRELEHESGGLIEAWFATFEPENLKQYQEARAQRLAQRMKPHAQPVH